MPQFRIWQKLKPIKSASFPKRMVFFDTETKGVQLSLGKEYHELIYGAIAEQRRYSDGSLSKVTWHDFTDTETFWDIIESMGANKELLTLYSHNGAFDLPVVDAFNTLNKRGWKLTKAIIESPPTYCRWSKNGRSIQFIDTLNIFREPLSSIGTSIGLEKIEFDAYGKDTEELRKYCRNDVEIIRRAITQWYELLYEEDLGGSAITLASQAFRTYRYKFMPDGIEIDVDKDALHIARSSYMGGRVECFRMGRYKGRFYYVDINSMYPHVMKENNYPAKLHGVYKRLEHNQLAAYCKRYRCVSHVQIQCDSPDYPVRRDGKLFFPVGTFDTYLTTPELLYALEHNAIKIIYNTAVYSSIPIFKDFVEYFYNKRIEADKRGDELRKRHYKILLNSLYGKFGQNGMVYETVGTDYNDVTGSWTEYDANTLKPTRYRIFGGMVQKMKTEAESSLSHPAIASHVTGYARMLLLNAINLVGRAHVYYCDTDSMLLDEVGFQTLHKDIHSTKLGKWKHEATYEDIDIRGPKDYRFGKVERIKGIRKTARKIDKDTYEQERFSSLKGLVREDSLNAPIITSVRKHLARQYTKGIVHDDGTITPIVMLESEPIATH